MLSLYTVYTQCFPIPAKKKTIACAFTVDTVGVSEQLGAGWYLVCSGLGKAVPCSGPLSSEGGLRA